MQGAPDGGGEEGGVDDRNGAAGSVHEVSFLVCSYRAPTIDCLDVRAPNGAKVCV
jgi:hypothetical protein